MDHIVAIDKDRGIHLPSEFLESFPPGTKVTLTVAGNAIRISKADASQQKLDPK